MRSTFYGFEIARSAIQASQAALDVVGQNVANVNTEGYTRQKVEQSAAFYVSDSDKYASVDTTEMGQGVNVDDITQIRNKFLDARFRLANSESSTENTSLSILKELENVLDETENDGLIDMISGFQADLESLSGKASNIEFKNLVRSSAQKVTETFNQYAEQIATIKEQQLYDLDIIVDDVNTTISKLDEVNTSIKNETIQGNVSNELLDMRNNYLDELSSYMNISVVNNEDGTVSVKSGDAYLLDAQSGTMAELDLSSDSYPITIMNTTDSSEFVISEGSIKGFLQVLNGKGTYAAADEEEFQGIVYYEQALDDLASSFSETFNDLNAFNGTDKPLFKSSDGGTITAANISISDEWLSDAGYITTTTNTTAEEGANDNILLMIHAMDTDTAITSGFTGTFEEFASSLMSDIAVDVGYATDISTTKSSITTSINNQRESVSGVSVNEETANMLTYQNSFDAASRLMTILDEALDTIINSMGRVGR